MTTKQRRKIEIWRGVKRRYVFISEHSTTSYVWLQHDFTREFEILNNLPSTPRARHAARLAKMREHHAYLRDCGVTIIGMVRGNRKNNKHK